MRALISTVAGLDFCPESSTRSLVTSAVTVNALSERSVAPIAFSRSRRLGVDGGGFAADAGGVAGRRRGRRRRCVVWANDVAAAHR